MGVWHAMKLPLFFLSNPWLWLKLTCPHIIWAVLLFIHSFSLSLPCCWPLSRNNSVSTIILDVSLSFSFVWESTFSSKGHWWPQRITLSGIQSNCITPFILKVLSVLWMIWYRAEPCRSGNVLAERPVPTFFERSGAKAYKCRCFFVCVCSFWCESQCWNEKETGFM